MGISSKMEIRVGLSGTQLVSVAQSVPRPLRISVYPFANSSVTWDVYEVALLGSELRNRYG